MAQPARERPNIGVGMPGMIKLNQFGVVLFDVFEKTAYLVGSAARGKQWRDVDVRVMLDDEIYDLTFKSRFKPEWTNPGWSGICLAFAALGREMTGFPIDFQVQRLSDANKLFGGQIRVPLGIFDRANHVVGDAIEPDDTN